MADTASIYHDQTTLASTEPGFIQHANWQVEASELLLEHLAHRVSRNPTDLRCHVQRVILCQRLQSHNDVYSALLDLFIALGEKGHSLRVRLLTQCRSLLLAQQHSVLEAALHSGINASDIVPLAKNSRLSAGVSGSLEIVSLVDENQSTSDMTVIDEAHDLLNSGHIKKACDLLEPALLASPQNAEISQELLTIYYHTRDITRLKGMLTQLKSNSFSAQEEWQALVTRLTTKDEHG